MADTDLVDVFEALAAGIKTQCPSLNCYPYMPERPINPAWYIGPIDIEPNNTFRGLDTMIIQSFLTVDRSGSPQHAQRVLANYLRRGPTTESESLRPAIKAMNANGLGGLAGGVNITAIEGWREYLFGECRMYGARVDIKVLGL